MRLFHYFAIFFLPLLVAAIPAAEPGANPLLVPRDDGGLPDLGDIGGLLGNILNSIGPVLDLLNPDTVNDIGTIVHNAADLLTPEFVEQTKGLIADVAPV